MDVFAAVAEPTRRAVLDLLADGERPAGELVAAFPALTQPAVSRHLRILRESQLVDVRADGTRRLYSLRPEALAELDRWLDTYRRFWSERLDDLEAHLDTKARREGGGGRTVTLADGTLRIVQSLPRPTGGDERGERIAVIAFERRLRHPIEAVWAALTGSEDLAAWLGPGSVEPRAGGEVSIRTGPEDRPERQLSISGRVLTWEPPLVLEHEWIQPGLDVSVVRYELEADGGETVLRFTHRRSVTPGSIGGRAGWHAYLDRLAAHLDGLAVPGWSERRAEVQDAYGEAPIPRA